MINTPEVDTHAQIIHIEGRKIRIDQIVYIDVKKIKHYRTNLITFLFFITLSFLSVFLNFVFLYIPAIAFLGLSLFLNRFDFFLLIVLESAEKLMLKIPRDKLPAVAKIPNEIDIYIKKKM